MGNVDYSAKKTLSKGLEQFLTIASSTVFATMIAAGLKKLTDKDFRISDIQEAIRSLSGFVVIMTPAISSIIQMIRNFYKNYFK